MATSQEMWVIPEARLSKKTFSAIDFIREHRPDCALILTQGDLCQSSEP